MSASIHWETWGGTTLVEIGKRRDGTPRRTLVSLAIILHTVTDARAYAKSHPHEKVVEVRTVGRTSRRLDFGG